MKRILLGLLFVSVFPSVLPAKTANEWLNQLYLHYNTADRLYLQFEQKTFHSVFKKMDVQRGEFWAEEGRYRLSLPGRTEVYDGTYLWVYVPTDREVQRQKTENARPPFRPKEILEKLKKDFSAELVREEKRTVVLQLRPRRREDAGPPVLLTFHPKSFLIGSMSWEEAGDTVTVKFLRTSRNLKISPKKFAFDPPRGVKITDLSL